MAADIGPNPWNHEKQLPLKLTVKNQNWHSAANWMKVSVSTWISTPDQTTPNLDDANKCTTALL